jgi:hypothetical protein
MNFRLAKALTDWTMATEHETKVIVDEGFAEAWRVEVEEMLCWMEEW